MALHDEEARGTEAGANVRREANSMQERQGLWVLARRPGLPHAQGFYI